MKAIVIGASGLVGSHLLAACQKRNWQVKGTYNQFAQTGLLPLQITDAKRIEEVLKEFEPNVVFLPAFRSNVDYCEEHPEETYQTNVVGSLNVAKAADDIGAQLVFYSSDYVFNGTDGPYRETDKPDPICIYGQQKLEIEQRIARLLKNHLILRITVVYGHEPQGKNFVSRLVKTLKSDKTIKVPQDQIGSPTLVDDIAEASCRLVEVDARGTFHVAGSDRLNRYQFALEVAEVFNLPTHNILPVTTAELQQVAMRPLKAGMICDHLVNTINFNLSGVYNGLNKLKQKWIS
jgi:dTDP-4-dehydrorhamnose reductase